MSVPVEKYVPNTDATSPPAYPPINVAPQSYQQYPMQSYVATSGPSAPEVQHHDGNNARPGGEEEGGEKKEEKEDDELIPGSGPGGVPDKYFKLDFKHFFEEHKDTKTFPALYRVVGLIYKYIKLVLYHALVIVVGIPMAVVWAIINGFMIFFYVWVWGPSLRFTIVSVYAAAPAVTVPIRAILEPLFAAAGLIFSKIHVRGQLSGGLGLKPEQTTV